MKLSTRFRTRYALLIVMVAVAAIYLAAVVPLVQGADDATYIVLAKALASGQGYRLIALPNAPAETHFPIGFPLLLSPVLVILPGFPLNVSALLLVSVLFGILTVPLLYQSVREYGGPAPAVAWIIVLIALLNPLTLLFTTQVVMSEVAYIWFSLAALYLASRTPESESWRDLRLLVLSLALAASYLIRVIGITLIVALLVDLLMRRRWRRAAMLAVLVSVLLLPWFARNSMVGTDPAAMGYSREFWMVDYARPELGTISTPLDIVVRIASNAWRHVSMILPGIFVPNLGGTAVTRLLGPARPALAALIGLALTGLLLLGMVRTWLTGKRLWVLYTVCYVGMILLAPWVTPRNWAPLIPLLAYFLWSGLALITAQIGRGQYHRLVPAALALLLAGMLIADRHYVHLGLEYKLQGRLPAAEGSLHEAWTWVRDQAGQDAILAYEFPMKLYLATGRQATGYASAADLPTAISQMRATGVSCLVSQSGRPAGDYYDGGEPPQVRQWLSDDPAGLVLAYASSKEPIVQIYCIDMELASQSTVQ